MKTENPAEDNADNLFRLFHFCYFDIFEKQHDGASDVDRRIGSDDDADQKGESEVVNDRSTENIQSQNRQKDGHRC